MHWRAIGLVMAGWLALTGCDSLPFIGGGDEAPADTAAAQTAAADTMTRDTATPPVATQPAAPAPEAAPAAERPTRSAPVRVAMDEPWTPTDTGTVSPGMSRDDVIGVWGTPVTERAAGNRLYLYFRNGCEVTCGTFDVVFLEGGQVVDAIVRGQGHRYSGTSSSPAGREALPTLPGTT